MLINQELAETDVIEALVNQSRRTLKMKNLLIRRHSKPSLFMRRNIQVMVSENLTANCLDVKF